MRKQSMPEVTIGSDRFDFLVERMGLPFSDAGIVPNSPQFPGGPEEWETWRNAVREWWADAMLDPKINPTFAGSDFSDKENRAALAAAVRYLAPTIPAYKMGPGGFEVFMVNNPRYNQSEAGAFIQKKTPEHVWDPEAQRWTDQKWELSKDLAPAVAWVRTQCRFAIAARKRK